MKRQSIRAVVLAVLMVTSVIAGVPIGTATATDDDAENWEPTGNEPVLDDDEFWHQAFAEYDGDLFIGAAEHETIYVVNEDLDVIDEYNVAPQPSGLTRFNGEWHMAVGEDNNLRTYDDDFDESEVVLDSSEFHETDIDESPWNIDAEDGLLYVADAQDIAVYDADYSEVDRFESEFNAVHSLHVVGESIYTTGDDGDIVHEYSLEGELLETYDISETVTDQANGFGLYNGHWYVGELLGESTQIYEFEADVGTDAAVSGTVTDQDGNSVPNASVTAVGVIDGEFEPGDPDALEAEAEALLAELDDPLPRAWDSSYDLDEHTEQSGTYALVHESRDWGVGTTHIADSSVEDPRLTVDADREVVLSLWDSREDGGWIENQVDQSFPGATTDGTVVVEQLAGSGETLETREYETEPIAETTGANPLTTTEHHGVETRLPVGVYRAYPDGHSDRGYVFTVGSPDEIASTIADDVRDDADQLTARAERIADLEADGVIERETVRTDENGEFELSVDERAVTVQVEAMKADGTVLEGVENPSLEDLREARLNGYNSSVYLPAPDGQQVDVPAEGVEVNVYRAPSVPLEDLESFADLQAFLDDALLDDGLGELDRWDERLGEIDADREDAIREVLEDALEDVPEDSTLEELQDRLAELEDTLDAEAPEVDIDDDEVTVEFPFADSVDPDDVAVLAHTADGETHAVDSEHWSVGSDGWFGGDRVVIDEYPFDAAAVDFEVVIDGEESGSVSEPVPNPAVGELPEIDAVDVSTLTPGPDERVSVGVDAPGESSFDSVSEVDVFGPDGEPVTAALEGGEATFDTDGEGVHHVRLTVVDSSGNEYVVSERVRAAEISRSDPPVIRAGSSVAGEYAVVSGLESAALDTDGETVDVTAVVGGSESPPAEIHVQPDAVLEGSSHEIDLSVVRGTDESAVNSHIGVNVHYANGVGESALIWQDDRAVTQDGETRYGEVSDRDDSKDVIRSFTRSDGTVTIAVNGDPSRTDRIWHWMDYSIPLLSVIGGVPVAERIA